MSEVQEKPRAPIESGVPDHLQYMHPMLKRNLGNWDWHDRPRPGVLCRAMTISSRVGAAPATTTTAEATTTTEAPLVDRGALSVVVANAGDSGGLAARGADALAALGYVFVVTADAAGTRETSAVLYAAGFQREAARLAADLGLPADAVAPFDDPSAITGPAGADLVVLLATELAA